jgi:superfamily I DNA/RNA helicase
MIWLPVVNNLPLFRYDLLMVDEAQDLNRCQQELAKRSGHRLVLCGDPKQAIYGFAGACEKSMEDMRVDLSVSGGCVTLPLTVTRRCGKAIVAEARKYVDDFEAFETNPEGKVYQLLFPRKAEDEKNSACYTNHVREGDFVLCRVNAPLASQCFRFIRAGRKANIQGRDIGQGLISTIKKLNASSVPDLVGKVTDWVDRETMKEQAKRNPSEDKLIIIQDRADCILVFTENATSVDEVIRRIEDVFTDDKTRPGIRLSSIHKAKGLEAHRVFLLQPKGGSVPHPMAKGAWQKDQEINLLYVAITRAIDELYFVYERGA